MELQPNVLGEYPHHIYKLVGMLQANPTVLVSLYAQAASAMYKDGWAAGGPHVSSLLHSLLWFTTQVGPNATTIMFIALQVPSAGSLGRQFAAAAVCAAAADAKESASLRRRLWAPLVTLATTQLGDLATGPAAFATIGGVDARRDALARNWTRLAGCCTCVLRGLVAWLVEVAERTDADLATLDSSTDALLFVATGMTALPSAVAQSDFLLRCGILPLLVQLGNSPLLPPPGVESAAATDAPIASIERKAALVGAVLASVAGLPPTRGSTSSLFGGYLRDDPEYELLQSLLSAHCEAASPVWSRIRQGFNSVGRRALRLPTKPSSGDLLAQLAAGVMPVPAIRPLFVVHHVVSSSIASLVAARPTTLISYAERDLLRHVCATTIHLASLAGALRLVSLQEMHLNIVGLLKDTSASINGALGLASSPELSASAKTLVGQVKAALAAREADFTALESVYRAIVLSLRLVVEGQLVANAAPLVDRRVLFTRPMGDFPFDPVGESADPAVTTALLTVHALFDLASRRVAAPKARWEALAAAALTERSVASQYLGEDALEFVEQTEAPDTTSPYGRLPSGLQTPRGAAAAAAAATNSSSGGGGGGNGGGGGGGGGGPSGPTASADDSSLPDGTAAARRRSNSACVRGRSSSHASLTSTATAGSIASLVRQLGQPPPLACEEALSTLGLLSAASDSGPSNVALDHTAGLPLGGTGPRDAPGVAGSPGDVATPHMSASSSDAASFGVHLLAFSPLRSPGSWTEGAWPGAASASYSSSSPASSPASSSLPSQPSLSDSTLGSPPRINLADEVADAAGEEHGEAGADGSDAAPLLNIPAARRPTHAVSALSSSLRNAHALHRRSGSGEMPVDGSADVGEAPTNPFLVDDLGRGAVERASAAAQAAQMALLDDAGFLYRGADDLASDSVFYVIAERADPQRLESIHPLIEYIHSVVDECAAAGPYSLVVDLTWAAPSLSEQRLFAQHCSDFLSICAHHYKKNLKAMYVVHPSPFSRAVLRATRPLLSDRGNAKMVNIYDWRDLGQYIDPDAISLPETSRAFVAAGYAVVKINARGRRQARLVKLTAVSLLSIDPKNRTVQSERRFADIDSVRVDPEDARRLVISFVPGTEGNDNYSTLRRAKRGRLFRLDDADLTTRRLEFATADSVQRFLAELAIVHCLRPMLVPASGTFDVVKVNQAGRRQTRRFILTTDSLLNTDASRHIRREVPLAGIASLALPSPTLLLLRLRTEGYEKHIECEQATQLYDALMAGVKRYRG